MTSFIEKLYSMCNCNDEFHKKSISWMDNNSFYIKNVDHFQNNILPKYFKHNNYSSFVRQLNMYDFTRKSVSESNNFEEIFTHKNFIKKNSNNLKIITRKTLNKRKLNTNEDQTCKRIRSLENIIETQNEEYKKQNEEYKKQNEEYKKQNEEIKKQYEEIKKQNKELTKQNEELTKQNEESKNNDILLFKIIKDLNNKYLHMFNKLNTEISESKFDIETMKSSTMSKNNNIENPYIMNNLQLLNSLCRI